MEELLSPLAGLIKIFEALRRLTKSPESGAQARFETLHKPLFDDFLVVHRNHIELFTNLYVATLNARDNEDHQQELMSKVASHFEKQRSEYEGVRCQLRAMSSELIVSASTYEEKAFVWTIVCYFMEHGFAHKDDNNVAASVRALSSKGGYHAVLNSPSSWVFSRLCAGVPAEEAGRIAIGVRDRLSGYLSDVCGAYASLKVKVYS